MVGRLGLGVLPLTEMPGFHITPTRQQESIERMEIRKDFVWAQLDTLRALLFQRSAVGFRR
jgi:hypothetical protein